MTDSTLNRFLGYGTHSNRVAFTPSPPTPASGPSPAYFWFETDTLTPWVYTSAWAQIGGPLPIAAQTASYTLVLADANSYIRMNVASANNLTVPPNSSVAFPTGTEITIFQKGAGKTTVVAGAGVTINTPNTLAIAVQYGAVTLKKVGTDEWDLMGYTG